MSAIIFNGKDAKLLTGRDLLDSAGNAYSKGEKSYTAAACRASKWSTSGAGVTIADDTTAADLPRPNTNPIGQKITGVSGSSDYAYFRFTLDPADYNTKLKVQLAINPLSGYASNDFKVDVYSNTASAYNGTSARLSLSTDSSSITGLPNLTGTFRTTFDAPGSAAPYIELRIGLNGTNTHALVISDLIVGPGIVTQGAAVTQWQSYTPTVVGNTTSANSAQYRRVGDTLQVQGYFAASNTTTATLTVSLPSGLTINTSALAKSGASDDVLGTAMVDASTYVAANVLYQSSTTVAFAKTGATSLINSSTTIVSGNLVDYNFAVPVNEWAGAGTLNVSQNDVEYVYSTDTTTTASVTNAFGYGTLGSAFGSWSVGTAYTRRVQFQTPVQAGQHVFVQVSSDGGLSWGEIAAQSSVVGYNEVSGTRTYGIYWTKVSATQIDVTFTSGGRTLPSTATGYGGNGSPFSDLVGGTYRWRLVKAYPNQAIGFGIVQPGVSAGLVSASGLTGNTTGSLIAAGFVGETFQDLGSTNTGITTAGNYQDACSRSLTAGLWRISWSVTFYNNGATNFTEAICGIGTASGNSAQDLVTGVNSIDQYKAAAVLGITFTDSINVLVSSTQVTVLNGASSGTPTGTARSGSTIYLKVYANDNTGGPVVFRYRMTCVRIA